MAGHTLPELELQGGGCRPGPALGEAGHELGAAIGGRVGEVPADKSVENRIIDADVHVAGVLAGIEASGEFVHGDREAGPVIGLGHRRKGGGHKGCEAGMQGVGSLSRHRFLLGPALAAGVLAWTFQRLRRGLFVVSKMRRRVSNRPRASRECPLSACESSRIRVLQIAMGTVRE